MRATESAMQFQTLSTFFCRRAPSAPVGALDMCSPSNLPSENGPSIFDQESLSTFHF
jgi:hypothetical protein